MAKKKYIPCDIYNRETWFFIGKEEELKKWVATEFTDEREKQLVETINNMEEDSTLCPAVTLFDWINGQAIVWLPKFPSSAEEIGYVVHEITHLVLNLLDFCDVEYTKNSHHEAYAYLAGWIAQNAFDKKGYEEVKIEENKA